MPVMFLKNITGKLPTSLVLISGLSYKITFNRELSTSSFPLYSVEPNLRNLFMKKITSPLLGGSAAARGRERGELCRFRSWCLEL